MGAAVNQWLHISDEAMRHGPLRGLVALYDHVGNHVLQSGPAGHMVAPAEIAHTADRIRNGGSETGRVSSTETDLTTRALRHLGLVALRHGNAPTTEPGLGWITALAWLRFGLSKRLRDDCVRLLHSRRFGETRLLHQQMVKGTLGDVAIEHVQINAVLTGTAPDECLVKMVHQRLTHIDRTQLQLLGASGFTADGSGRLALVSELLANVYVGPFLPRDST
jgi:hypothetical protein